MKQKDLTDLQDILISLLEGIQRQFILSQTEAERIYKLIKNLKQS